jgi:hypothetical protein
VKNPDYVTCKSSGFNETCFEKSSKAFAKDLSIKKSEAQLTPSLKKEQY